MAMAGLPHAVVLRLNAFTRADAIDIGPMVLTVNEDRARLQPERGPDAFQNLFKVIFGDFRLDILALAVLVAIGAE